MSCSASCIRLQLNREREREIENEYQNVRFRHDMMMLVENRQNEKDNSLRMGIINSGRKLVKKKVLYFQVMLNLLC